ncbi:MAG TPA: methyl-accepting chemotaxis protein, partial [Anaeromyxobacter sp.]|nr:methyl-accepting chemotaxis protein [Anaeromyxobacter sp.]
VQQISQQTRIIAVNGAVEAAGNAERSRTFGNVARDMVKLAEDTHRAGKEISAALAEISEAVRALSAAGERLVQAARVRGAAAAEGLGAVARIRDGLAEVLRSFDEGGAGARR